MGVAYRAWVKQELTTDDLKAAVFALDKMVAAMRGPEAEQLVADIKAEWATSRAPKASSHERHPAH
jgi:hypothetical protein